MTGQQQAMLDAARRCLCTPFHHQGRQPGVGLDCIGLIIVAMTAAGLRVQDRQDYGPRPDGQSLVSALLAHGAMPVTKIMPCDILLFRYDQQPQHVGLAVTEDSMIHAFAPAERVVECSLGDYWQRRLLGIYRFSERND